MIHEQTARQYLQNIDRNKTGLVYVSATEVEILGS